MAHRDIDEKEHKRRMAKVAIEILRREFNNLSLSSNLCTLSGFHIEAKTIAEAKFLIREAMAQLAKRQEVE